MPPLNDAAHNGLVTSTATTQVFTHGAGKQAPGKDNLADRIHVNRSSEAFASGAVSKIDVPAGSVFAKISTATPGKKAYTSVQVAEDAHVELNSDLVFCNHSCAPTLEFDMARWEVRAVRDRDLKKGDLLTFFYPSSEWEMAQPFECTCGAGENVCCGTIRGAGEMDDAVLRRYWLNGHIERMLAAKKATGKAGNADRAKNGVETEHGVADMKANGVRT